MRPPVRSLLATCRTLLAGGLSSLVVVSAIVLLQRLALPLSVLWIGDYGNTAAAATLLGAAALSFVRARAAERLSRHVRLNLFDLYLAPFEHAPAPLLPQADAVTARLAIASPTLVGWAVDGVCVTLASIVAVPIVAALLASAPALGASALFPLGVAGAVGAAVTMAASSRVEDAYNRAWDRSRGVLTAVSAAYDGAIELRAHGLCQAVAQRLRGDVASWSEAEGRARLMGSFASWGALSATLLAGFGASLLVAPQMLATTSRDELYKSWMLVLAAIPTMQSLVSGIGTMLYARDEIESARRQRAIALEQSRQEHDEPIDAAAEVRLCGIDYTYPGGSGPSAPALAGVTLVLPPRASVAITGGNGTGKTTLLYVLLGIVRPDRGRIEVAGHPAELDNRRWRARIAFLSQRPLEIPGGTIGDNLRAFDAKLPDARLVAVLKQVGVWAALRERATDDGAVLHLPYGALSRGQGRRVLLARALAREADLVILDEPEANLDAAAVTELGETLRELSRERRIVAAVHNRTLLAFADQVIDLEEQQSKVAGS